MNNNNQNYVFNVNWEDRGKHIHKVGMLAQINDIYYFFIRSKEKAMAPYKSGFIGISGFEPEKIYRSPELFDFFKSRILDKKSSKPCEELAETNGKSMVDSFSVEKLSDKIAKQYEEIILQAYEIQQKRKELESKKENIK